MPPREDHQWVIVPVTERHFPLRDIAAMREHSGLSAGDARPADLMAALRLLRTAAGGPSWRAIARNARDRLPAPLIRDVMQANGLPTAEQVGVIVAGLGGDHAVQRLFLRDWRHVYARQQAQEAPGEPAPADHH